MKKAAILAILAIVFSIHPTLAQVFSIYTLPANPHTGEFTLAIQVNSTCQISDVSIHLLGLIDKTIYVGDITSGVVEIPVKVTEPGTYTVKAWISYTFNSSSYHEILEKVVNVYPVQKFEVLGISGNVIPDSSGNVTFIVKNCGKTVRDVKVTLKGFDCEKSTKTISLWKENETLNLVFKIYAPPDESGVRKGYLSFIYPEFGRRVVEDIPVGVNFTGNPKLVLSEFTTTPSRIYPNSNFTLKVGVENTGSREAKGVIIRLILPHGIKGENISYIGDLKRNAEKTATFELSTSNFTGAVKIGVLMSCEGRTFKESGELYVFPVSSMVDISGVYTIPERVVAGKTFTLNIAIENSGKQKVRGVWIELRLPPGFKGRNTYYIGSLDSGDSATSTFQITAGNAGEHTFVAEIHYLDYSYRPHVKVEKFTLYVFPGNNYYLLIVAIPAVIAAYLLRKYLLRKHIKR